MTRARKATAEQVPIGDRREARIAAIVLMYAGIPVRIMAKELAEAAERIRRTEAAARLSRDLEASE